jgi:hypothetical protein
MRKQRLVLVTAGALIAAGSLALAPAATTTAASPQPYKDGGNRAMGAGLGRLVQESQGPKAKSLQKSSGVHIDQSRLAVRDSQGRVLVQLTPQRGVDRAAFRKDAEANGLVVKAVDAANGTLEGFIPLSAANTLASMKGTGTIAQSIKPSTNIGKATSQGVAIERADKVQAKGIDGKGITVGALSDSYDVAQSYATGEPLDVHAAQDVKSGDLPGKGNAKYPTPVVNLEDSDDPVDSEDEGRAMLQIVHDVAPAAKLCFASAFNSEIGFADNIRRLADKNGKCKANVIVDDVTYFDEPMFSDGPIGDAVDDVAKQGVHYFSSVGNAGEAQSWDSPVRLVPASKGVQGTNLDFSQVDPSLYDGGLQDMDTGPGTNVAQDISVGDGGGLFNLQWDDPFDLNGTQFGSPYYQSKGELTGPDDVKSFTFHATSAQVGKQVLFRTDGVPSGATDLILEVIDPDGNSSGQIDAGASPEVFGTTLKKAGAYTIKVSGFDGDTGPFTVDVRPVLAPSKVTTDFNVLLFDPEGNYLGAVADLNKISGRPQEISALDGLGDVQMVISRSGTGKVGATHLRDILDGDLYFTSLNDPLAPATFGHHTAAGATAVGAYDPFRPFLPEFFTSPGGDLKISYDSAGNKYAKPQVRRVPQVSGVDGGNTTFFTNDSLLDPDTQRNFFGTSAAAPHVAAIAALVLQKAGGPKSLTPTQLRSRLESSTYAHDLDPNRSGGSAGGLSLTANGPQGYEQDIVPGPMNDPRFFTLRYSGSVPVTSVTLYGETASPTAPGIRNPPASDGIVFDPRPFGVAPFRDDGFPFTIGSTSGGLSSNSVRPKFSVPNGGQSAARQYRHLTLNFGKQLKQGQSLQFGVDRDIAASGYGGSVEGNGADELGGATFLPSGVADPRGLKFVATLANGKTLTGYMYNKLGQGYTPLDGYGLVNAEKAVLGH